MGLLDRLSGRAPAYNPEDDYDYPAENYAEEYYEEEAAVEPIRAVEQDVSRIVTVWVASYKEIRDFAVEFREGLPVILNLSDAPDAERARIVDFALGLCFGLDGLFSRISEDVFLLTPHSVKLDSRGEAEPREYLR